MWIVSQLTAIVDGQHNPAPALTVGAAAVVAVTVVHRIIRRIERMIWKAATWALVGGAGVLLVAEGAKDGVILVAGDVEVMKALPA